MESEHIEQDNTVNENITDVVNDSTNNDSSNNDNSNTENVADCIVDDLKEGATGYNVRVKEPTRNGDVLSYPLFVQVLPGTAVKKVSREYEDFTWLYHCLRTECHQPGIIYPPLPVNPQLTGSNSEIGINGSESFALVSQSLQVCLTLITSHPILGKSNSLKTFLTEVNAPTRVRLSESLLTKLSTSVNEIKKSSSHKDLDPDFRDFRAFVYQYKLCTSSAYSASIRSSVQLRKLSFAMDHMSTCLRGAIIPTSILATSDTGRFINTIYRSYSDTLSDFEKHYSHEANLMQLTLGDGLGLIDRYTKSVNDSLYERTCLLIEYEDSVKMFDKAKTPDKKAQAEEVKLKASSSYEDCCTLLKSEIANYKSARLSYCKKAMVHYAEERLRAAIDAKALLNLALEGLRSK